MTRGATATVTPRAAEGAPTAAPAPAQKTTAANMPRMPKAPWPSLLPRREPRTPAE